MLFAAAKFTQDDASNKEASHAISIGYADQGWRLVPDTHYSWLDTTNANQGAAGPAGQHRPSLAEHQERHREDR